MTKIYVMHCGYFSNREQVMVTTPRSPRAIITYSPPTKRKFQFTHHLHPLLPKTYQKRFPRTYPIKRNQRSDGNDTAATVRMTVTTVILCYNMRVGADVVW